MRIDCPHCGEPIEVFLPSRDAVREVPCPSCGAAPGACCVGARGKPRASNHVERVDAYMTQVHP